MFILLVTWFYAGQAPQSYQVRYSSGPACEAARAQVLREAERLASPAACHRVPGSDWTACPVAPTVSAICTHA